MKREKFREIIRTDLEEVIKEGMNPQAFTRRINKYNEIYGSDLFYNDMLIKYLEFNMRKGYNH